MTTLAYIFLMRLAREIDPKVYRKKDVTKFVLVSFFLFFFLLFKIP